MRREQLRGLSIEKAELYGKPHIGAHYTGHSATSYERTWEWCAICGRRAQSVHHVAHRSWGDRFELVTNNGEWSLRSPLFALCGSGTTGCHDGFHMGAYLRARWVWDDPLYQDAWWDGLILARFKPHHPAIYRYGYWAIDDLRDGTTIRIREEQ